MNDTPETDYALKGVWYRGDGPGAFPDHARRMERERDQAIEHLRALCDVVCKRLAAGDEATTSDRMDVRMAWDRANKLLERMAEEKKIREGAKR